MTVKNYTEAFRRTDTRGEGRITLDYNQFVSDPLSCCAVAGGLTVDGDGARFAQLDDLFDGHDASPRRVESSEMDI